MMVALAAQYDGLDHLGRLTEAVHCDLFGGTIDWRADYQYDAMNHRVASLYDDDGDGVTDRVERYVWDGDRIVLDFVDSDGANNSLNNGTESAPLALATRYLWGPAVDQLLAQETVDDGGLEDVVYPVIDNLHSVRSLVNSDGDITATYSYDTYGNVTALVGTLTDTRFLYTCQEYDQHLGLYYYNARWYDPSIGKFISEDPIGYKGGINLYGYAGNDPLTRTDPGGTAFCQCSCGWFFKSEKWVPEPAIGEGDCNAACSANGCSFTGYVGPLPPGAASLPSLARIQCLQKAKSDADAAWTSVQAAELYCISRNPTPCGFIACEVLYHLAMVVVQNNYNNAVARCPSS